MSTALLLLPDFTLILLGALLFRGTRWHAAFWSGLEQLVYFVLFPCLLFYSTARAPLDFGATGALLETAVITCLAGIALGWLAKALFAAGPMLFESGVQSAFRFNSYIGLALASRLDSQHGAALMALMIGVGVPLCNVAAVHALVRRKGNLLLELLKNPLLMAALLGTVWNLTGVPIPEFIGASLSRLGNASVALGLIAVGAGMRASGLHEGKAMATYFIAVKLLALPLVAWLVGRLLGLSHLSLQIAVLFAALPTASSAYVLATRLGGNGPFVAFLISAGTVISMLTLPLWLSFVG